MLLRTKIFASAAVIALSTGYAAADGHTGPTSETVLATVDGAEITLGQLILAASQLPPEYGQLSSDVIFEGLLNQLVDQQILADSLVDEPKRVGIAVANQIRTLRASAIINEITSRPISDEELQAAYDAQFEGFNTGPEFRASHILVETEEDAIAIKDMIDGGADFAATAIAESTGPSGPSGGDLGWFGLGAMVPEFEAVVLELEVGEVSGPIQTQFGWHIVKLDDEGVTAPPALDTMRAELETRIYEQAMNELVSELKAGADVVVSDVSEFDTTVIRNFELLED